MRGLIIVIACIVCGFGCQRDPHYEQLLIGFNGPSTPQATLFQDAQSVQASWLAEALDAEELSRVISKTSFDTQILVVTAVGERETVTGSLKIDRIERYGNSLLIYLFIGVNECSSNRSKSYPFALALVDRPSQFNGAAGYFHQNFPDGCKPVKSGEPNS